MSAALRFIWTPETEAEAKRLWTEGHSSSQIAAKFRATRNQVIGKLNRLGLTRTKGAAEAASRINTPRPAPKAPAVKRQVDREAAVHIHNRATGRAKKIIIGNGAVMDATDHSKELGTRYRAPGPNAASHYDLPKGRCLMPVGDIMAPPDRTLFCGEAASTGSYCAGCHPIAYRPPKESKASVDYIAKAIRRHA